MERINGFVVVVPITIKFGNEKLKINNNNNNTNNNNKGYSHRLPCELLLRPYYTSAATDVKIFSSRQVFLPMQSVLIGALACFSKLEVLCES